MNSWFHRLTTGVAYVPILAATLGLVAGIRAWYKRTLGRRSDSYARIARLGTNAHLGFFNAVLGEPPAMHRSLTSEVSVLPDGAEEFIMEERAFLTSVWINRDYYVHAVSDHDGAVAAFSVTVRTPRFHPRLRSPGVYVVERGRLARLLRRPAVRPIFDVRLGASRFDSLEQPTTASAWLGAHNLHYHEAHWLGNPGNYQWYVFSINDAGALAWDAPFVGTLMGDDPPWDFAWGFDADHDQPFDEMQGWHDFRRRARINTYTVIAPTMLLENYPPRTDQSRYPVSFGPNSDQVRTVP